MSSRDLPFDLHPVHRATVQDLSAVAFERFNPPNAFAPEVLAANERSLEQRLAACRMVVAADDPTPTVTGLLALGRDPQAYLPHAAVQFLRMEGNSLAAPFTDALLIGGALGDLTRRLDDKLLAHNRTALDIRSGSL